jgi:hypothetical protein
MEDRTVDNKIQILKKYLGVKYTEKIFDITNPIPYQCKKIDDCINNLDTDEISDIKQNYESLRKKLEEVREWGQEWKNTAKNLFNKLPIEVIQKIIDKNLTIDELNELFNQKENN